MKQRFTRKHSTTIFVLEIRCKVFSFLRIRDIATAPCFAWMSWETYYFHIMACFISYANFKHVPHGGVFLNSSSVPVSMVLFNIATKYNYIQRIFRSFKYIIFNSTSFSFLFLIVNIKIECITSGDFLRTNHLQESIKFLKKKLSQDLPPTQCKRDLYLFLQNQFLSFMKCIFGYARIFDYKI